MGRWRYVNFAILVAVLVFLYIGVFSSASLLAPKALGPAAHPWAPVDGWRVRAGHAATLTPGKSADVQIQLCPGCYREIRDIGAAVSVERPDDLEAPAVAKVRGAPYRFAARVPVLRSACGDDVQLWVGAADWSGTVHWASWDIATYMRPCPSENSG